MTTIALRVEPVTNVRPAEYDPANVLEVVLTSMHGHDCWPDNDLLYSGNAHMEAAEHGIVTCFERHPDDPSDCVACEVEEGNAIMIRFVTPVEDLIAHHTKGAARSQLRMIRTTKQTSDVGLRLLRARLLNGV